MSVDDESSWRLLFSIALSHGTAVETGRLGWEGWMVFLSSARLIGTTTGVFPVLLDQIWQRQAISAEAAQNCGDAAHEDATFTFCNALDETPFLAVSDSAPNSADFVEFGGFADMMKVLCVRVYQTFQFANMQEKDESQGDAVLAALRRCAEDRVLLTEAVGHTASRYLRPFITKSTIHASSRVSLRAARNGWALHVNRLITHVVGSLARPVIVPLFRTYADAATGRMTEEGYRGFLKDNLPGLNTIEETCALAIFAHGGFPDVRPLLKTGVPHADPSSEVSLLTSVRTLGLTDFVEALLMLAVVVCADEERHPRLRPITAKVWVFFDRYVCNGKKRRDGECGVSMCADPYVSGRYTAVPPGLVGVFPTVAPLLLCPTLMVEVFNATCLGAGGGAGGETTAHPFPSQSAQLQAPSAEETTPFLTEVSVTISDHATVPLSSPPLPADATHLTSAETDTAVVVASTFFESQWSLLERNMDVPLFGESSAATACEVAVGGTVVEVTPTACPDIWAVSLSAVAPASLRLTRCAVETTLVPEDSTATSAAAAGVESGAAADGCCGGTAVRLIFTPMRSFSVELIRPECESPSTDVLQSAQGARDGSQPWGCKDVVLTDSPVTQLVSPFLVQRVRALLDDGAHDAFNEAAAANATATTNHAVGGSPLFDGATYPLTALCEACRRLQWCPTAQEGGASNLVVLCRQALTSCRLHRRMLHPGSAPDETETRGSTGDSAQRMSLAEVLACLSVLLLGGDAGGLRNIPDVPRRLELVLHTASLDTRGAADAAVAQPSTSKSPAEKNSAGLCRLPHNKLRDEPFKLALERKEAQSAASRDRRAALLRAIQSHHKEQMPGPVALPLLSENRPNAARLVSQHGNVDPASNFQRVMLEGAETIKAYFIEKELAIPEWQGP